VVEEVEPNNDPENPDKKTTVLPKGGSAIPMTALAFALIGFVAGLFTMSMISLYKYVVKRISR